MLTRLTDGTRVVIRHIRPEDKELLRAALKTFSADTMRKRFLVPKSRFTASELSYLTEVDGRDHYAVVATLLDHPDRIIAVGRFVRLPSDPLTAEAAVVVADEFQGKCLGTRLGLHLADAARDRGIRRFSASILSDNAAAHRLFAHVSERLSSRVHDGVDELVADFAA